MQKLITLSIAAILLIFSQPVLAEKYALIVAIGDYPEPGKNGWGKISSANDLPLIKTALENQGFSTTNIFTLQDAAATKQGIQDAFDALLNKVTPGVVVFIHFSSHGKQIEHHNN
jgi:hypothetical protein